MCYRQHLPTAGKAVSKLYRPGLNRLQQSMVVSELTIINKNVNK